MKTNQFLDIDLDYFNDSKNPLEAFQRVVWNVPKSIPCQVFIEHQKIRPFVKKIAKTHGPLEIYRVDAHHDYYWGTPRKVGFTDCSNFSYSIPTGLYTKFVWINNSAWRNNNTDWQYAKMWLEKRNKEVQRTKSHCWQPSKIAAVSITISPDYCNRMFTYQNFVQKILEYSKIRFNLKTVPRTTRPNQWWILSEWTY